MPELPEERIVMAGLSGGGWTTTLAAALDARIETRFNYVQHISTSSLSIEPRKSRYLLLAACHATSGTRPGTSSSTATSAGPA